MFSISQSDSNLSTDSGQTLANLSTKTINNIKFSGLRSEYVFSLAPELGGCLIVTDKLPNRDYTAIISNTNCLLEFLDIVINSDNIGVFLLSDLSALKSKQENNFDFETKFIPFKQKFTIIENDSEYIFIKFGKDVELPNNNINSIQIYLFGYSELKDSVQFEPESLPDEVSYSYAILRDCFSINFSGNIKIMQLRYMLDSFAWIAFCDNRQLSVRVIVDDSVFFDRNYCAKDIK